MPETGNYRGSGPDTAIGQSPVLHPCLLVFALLLPAEASAAEYVVRVDPGLTTLHVAACFDAPVPAVVYADSGQAGRYLREARADGRALQLDADGRLPLGGSERSCLEYAVDARSAVRSTRFAQAPGVLLLDPGDWLWLPPAASVHFLRFELPDGVEVSAPWPEAGMRRFRFDTRTRDGPGLVAIGTLRMERVSITGSELRLAMLPGSPPADPAFVRDWVRRGAEAITMIYGSFPVPAPQVLVVPLGEGGEPVPWGQVQRGGGVAAHLFIDQTRPAAEFADDWVLVHELSHFVHPDLGADSAWLSEGLATYYQYVARARAGMMPEQEAWQKLHEGFERGRAQTQPGQDLIAAASAMREQRLFMRVYWTGTAMAMLADLALRNAGTSLDDVLREFRDCCLAEQKVWDTADFLAQLDRLSSTTVFSDLDRRYLHSDQFPDLEGAYVRLGLRSAHGRLEFDMGEAPRRLRRAILGPRS